jgi:GntR family transcriptional regulator/MocR family aminotransferase
MVIYLNRKDSTEPLYQQVYSEIKRNIENGNLQPGYKLKSLRRLQEELNVSKNTVDRAYQQLIAEGYIQSSQGMGYYVNDISAIYFSNTNNPEKINPQNHPSHNKKVKYDFEFQTIQADLFPWVKWRKYVNEAIQLERCDSAIAYEDGKGNLKLREALSSFLYRHRGVVCTAEQIVLCAGIQHAMQILSTLLPKEKNRFAFEEPGYNAMRYFVEGCGYSVTSIPVFENGVYPKLLSISNCNVLYTNLRLKDESFNRHRRSRWKFAYGEFEMNRAILISVASPRYIFRRKIYP